MLVFLLHFTRGLGLTCIWWFGLPGCMVVTRRVVSLGDSVGRI